MLEQNKTRKMKTLKINKLILLLIGLVVFNSCVEDDDFDTPNTSIVEPNIPADQIKLMTALAGDLAQEQSANDGIFDPQPLDYSNEDDIVDYVFDEEDVYVTGYVVSSDEAGNFFEEIIIQDKPENPTIGIKFLIDVNPLFVRYEVGRKVYIKLNGLSVGITNGVLTLGTNANGEVDKVAPSLENDVVLRSNEVATITPLSVNVSDFEDDLTNLCVELVDVQFASNQVLGDNPLTYASEQQDQFDGERTLESCAESGSSVTFSTSTFADFKGLSLPTGRGSLKGILTKNFEGEAFNIVVNSPEDVNFDNATRCDPLFQDSFAAGNLDLWTPYSVTGPQEWYYNTFGNPSDSATMSGFSGGAVENEDWLISLPIDLSAVSTAFFSFDNVKRYSGNDIEVYYTTAYNGGDPNTDGAWTQLFPALDSDTGSWSSWVNSGAMDVSDAAGGDLYIAIKYTSTSSSAATWEIDNVSVSVE